MQKIRKVQDDVDEYLKDGSDKRYNYKGSFQAMSFTIPSMVPSWWEKRDGKTILVQKCISDSDEKRPKPLYL